MNLLRANSRMIEATRRAKNDRSPRSGVLCGRVYCNTICARCEGSPQVFAKASSLLLAASLSSPEVGGRDDMHRVVERNVGESRR